jgi:hypothetical protein
MTKTTWWRAHPDRIFYRWTRGTQKYPCATWWRQSDKGNWSIRSLRNRCAAPSGDHGDRSPWGNAVRKRAARAREGGQQKNRSSFSSILCRKIELLEWLINCNCAPWLVYIEYKSLLKGEGTSGYTWQSMIHNIKPTNILYQRLESASTREPNREQCHKCVQKLGRQWN